MSLVGKIETDVHLNASADQFYEFFRNKPHHVENITPGKVKGVFKHRGDFGKVGSIIAWHYVLGKFITLLFWFKSRTHEEWEPLWMNSLLTNICYMASSYFL